MNLPRPPAQTALPGPMAPDFPTSLATKLAQALLDKGAAYTPRTRHLSASGAPLYMNRLLLEASPYLQQHAHNPVNWFPWGDEAFALARELGRPLLLSVGYATCHWCHVMEEESFEDPAIAAYMNANYIAVKVDREERPDVDSVYMACVQAWSGHGGWPMTVWLTPDKQPFFGGTYFPPTDGARGARVGFQTLLEELKRTYQEQPERVAQAAASVIAHIQDKAQRAAPEAKALSSQQLSEAMATAYRYYDRLFDADWGGLGGAPKFPSSLPVRFLLRYGQRYGEEAQAMAVLSLERMAEGGMRDQIGGGFHRYSVDAEWLVPHFEKMLYDNALLAQAYLEAWQVTGRADFAAVATTTLDYALREMTAPGGGFYAATDADSANPLRGGEREEGWFFTWTPAEFEAVLGQDLAGPVAAYYGVTAGGNFEGRSILHTLRPLKDVATELNLSASALEAKLAAARPLLYASRATRPAPLLDDKIITSWNALMISACARAALAMRRDDYLAAATRAAEFTLQTLFSGERLVRCYKDGPSKTHGFLEDYAFTIQACLDLYEASFDLTWLDFAVRLTALTRELFAAPEGGYYLAPADGEALLIREKPSYDGAVPSGNSVHALNLLRLAVLTDKQAYRAEAERAMLASAEILMRTPAALSEMLLAADFALSEPKQILLIGATAEEREPFLRALGRSFIPNRVLAGGSEEMSAAASRLIPLLSDKRAAQGRATAYVCEGQECKLPVQDSEDFLRQLSPTFMR